MGTLGYWLALTLSFLMAANNPALGYGADEGLELLVPTLEHHQRDTAIVEWSQLPVEGAIPFRGTHAVYFVIDECPADEIVRFPRLNNQVRTAVFLTMDGESLTSESQRPPHYRRNDVCELTQSPTEWMLVIPESRAYPLVVVLDLVGEPNYSPEPHVETPSADASVVLSAHHAVVHGEKLQYEPLPHKNTVGYWANPDDWVEWRFEAPPGEYTVELLQGCGEGQGGSRVRMEVDEAAIDFDVEETGHFQNFRWREMGPITLADDGEHELSLRTLALAESAVMDVRQIRLLPVEATRPDRIELVPPDLVIPPLFGGPPFAGRRVLHTLPETASDSIYHTLYLPTDWRDDRKYPVLVELTGNGPYRNQLGDVCTGRPEDAELGLGLTGGDGWIWLSLPYLSAEGTELVTEWWGDPPDYDVAATLDYWRRAIDDVCDNYGGDPECIVLAGFSRGSIACNYLGLHDDSISARWKGFVCNSHYDGVLEDWPYPNCDRASALDRLHRLAGRPQLILSETSDEAGVSLDAVRRYLADSNEAGQWTFLSTGYRNHSDDWALRPSPERRQVRQWLNELIEYEMHPR